MYRQGMTIPLGELDPASAVTTIPAASATTNASPASANTTGETPLSTPLQQSPPTASKDTQVQRRVRFANDAEEPPQPKPRREESVTSPPSSAPSHTRILDELLAAATAGAVVTSPPPPSAPPPPPSLSTASVAAATAETSITQLEISPLAPEVLARAPPPVHLEKGKELSLLLDDDVGSAEWKTQFMHNAQNLLRESQRQIQALLHYQTAYEAEVLVTRELREQLRLATEAAAQSRLAQQLDTTRQLKKIQQLQDETGRLTAELGAAQRKEAQLRADGQRANAARETAEAEKLALQREARKHAQQLEQAQQEARRGHTQLEAMARETVHLQSVNLKLEAELFEAQRRVAQARRTAAGNKEDSVNVSAATVHLPPQRDVDDGGGAPLVEDTIRSMQAYFVTLKSELAKSEGAAANYKQQLSQAEVRHQELLRQLELQAAELAVVQEGAAEAAAAHHARLQQLKDEMEAQRRAWEEEQLDYKLQEMDKKQLFLRADACLEETLALCMATTAEMEETAEQEEAKETQDGARWWVEGKAKRDKRKADGNTSATLQRSLDHTREEGADSIQNSLLSEEKTALPYLSVVLHKVQILKEAVQLLCTYTQQQQQHQQQEAQQRQRLQEQREKDAGKTEITAEEQQVIASQREEIAHLQRTQTQLEARLSTLLQKVKADEAAAHSHHHSTESSWEALQSYLQKHRELLYNALREYAPKTRKLADAVTRREDALSSHNRKEAGSGSKEGEERPAPSLILQDLLQAQQDFLLLLSTFREQAQAQRSSITKLKQEKEDAHKKLSDVEKKLSEAEEKVRQQAQAKQIAAQLRRKENEWARLQQAHEQQHKEWQSKLQETEQQAAEKEKRLKLLQKKLDTAQQTATQLQQDKEAWEKECTLLTETLMRVKEEMQHQTLGNSSMQEQLVQKGEEALRREQNKSVHLHRVIEDCVRFMVLLLCKIETLLQQKRYLWQAQVEPFCELQHIKQLLRQLSIREDAKHKLYLLDVKPAASLDDGSSSNQDSSPTSSSVNVVKLRSDLAAIRNPSTGPRTTFKRSLRVCALGVLAITRLSVLLRQRRQQQDEERHTPSSGGKKTFLTVLLPSLRHLLQPHEPNAAGDADAWLPRVEIPSAADLVDAAQRVSSTTTTTTHTGITATTLLHYLLQQARVDTQSAGYQRVAYQESGRPHALVSLDRERAPLRAPRRPGTMLSYFNTDNSNNSPSSDAALQQLFFAPPSTFAVCRTVVAFLAAQQRLVGGLLAEREEEMEGLTQQNKQLGLALESQRREHLLIEKEIANIEEKLAQQQQQQQQQQQSRDQSMLAEPPSEVVAELRRSLVEALTTAQQEKNERRQCEERIVAYKKREVHFLMQQNELENEIRSLRIELNSGPNNSNNNNGRHTEDGVTLLRHHNDSRPLLQDELSRIVTRIKTSSTRTRNPVTTKNNNNNNHNNVNVSDGAASSSHRVAPSSVANVSGVSSTAYGVEESLPHFHQSRSSPAMPPPRAAADVNSNDPYQLYAPASVRRQKQQQQQQQQTQRHLEQEVPSSVPSLVERHVNVDHNVHSYDQDGKSPSTASQTATQQSLY